MGECNIGAFTNISNFLFFLYFFLPLPEFLSWPFSSLAEYHFLSRT